MTSVDLKPMLVVRRVAARVRSVRSDERGAVLVIVASLMTLALPALAALAIDAGSFYQAQRRAQAAADAGALAGAQALPDTAAASAAATTLATTNYPGASLIVPAPTSTSVSVTVSASTPTFFGQILGLTHADVSASATAALNSSFTPCSTSGNGCLAIFAAQKGCSDSIVFGGGVHVTGGVWSNGSIDFGGGGSSWGPSAYATGCTPTYGGGNYTFTPSASDPSAQTPLPGSSPYTWPLPYGNDFPACGGSGPACTGPCDNGTSCTSAYKTPSFCTSATNAATETLQTYNPVNLTSGQIYCDVGGGNANDPSTWTGAMTINASNGTTESSFVAGSITIGGGSNLTGCGYALSGYSASACNAAVPAPSTTNYPVLYAANGAINAKSGGGNFKGDLYAPNGAITIGGGDSTSFMEGLTVNWSSGGITGDGPVDTGSGGISTSSEALTQ